MMDHDARHLSIASNFQAVDLMCTKKLANGWAFCSKAWDQAGGVRESLSREGGQNYSSHAAGLVGMAANSHYTQL